MVLLSGCAVKIADEQFCAVIPGGNGAACDWLLHSDQQILTEDQWQAQQVVWNSQGQAVECTTAATVGNIKSEIETLCSEVKCDYQTKTHLLNGLAKIEKLGKDQLK